MTNKEDGRVTWLDLGLWSGKTSAEHSAQTKAKTSKSSLKKQQGSQTKPPLFLNLRKTSGQTQEPSWEMGGLLLGEYTMHSFGVYPREENASRLSQILEENPHPKYCLSAKACQGILRRAEKRGKELPPTLKEALERQSAFKSEPDVQGGGKGILIQNERTGALSTLNNQSVCYGLCSFESNAMKSSNPHSGVYEAETSRTLDLNGGSPACNQGGMAIVDYAAAFKFGNSANARSIGYREQVSPSICGGEGGNQKPCVVCVEGNGSRESHRGDGYKESETMYTLNTIEQHAVCIGNGQVDQLSESPVARSLNCMHKQQNSLLFDAYRRYGYRKDETCGTLTKDQNNGIRGDTPLICESAACDIRNGKENIETNGALQRMASNNLNSNNVCRQGSVVRRLTPLECERLQGFPDGWTDIGDWIDGKGKKHKGDSDSPRYKALGNSIALPFWFCLLRRISAQYERPATLGSLFDGIGGFPLCWERCNGQGTALFASEIEEFPIAVTKYHFGEDQT